MSASIPGSRAVAGPMADAKADARIQSMIAAEIRRPSEEFRSELIPVEVSLGCADLPMLAATGSCLSVFAVLFVRKPGSGGRWQEHGRTEVVRAGGEPQFARSFFVDYLDHDDVLRNEEYDTWVRVELFQHTGTAAALMDLEKQKRCGWVETTLRELYRTPVKKMPLALKFSRACAIKQGSLELRIADAPRNALQPFVELNLSASLAGNQPTRTAKAPGGGSGSRSGATGEYFVTCHRYTIGGVFELYYRTERAKPAIASAAAGCISFEPVKQSLQRCCFGQRETFLRFQFWQEDKLGFHQMLGEMDTTLNEMMEAQQRQQAIDNRAAEQEAAKEASEQQDQKGSSPRKEEARSRKEGRRRRRAATPGNATAVTSVRYELKEQKVAKGDTFGAAWVPGSMGVLPLEEAPKVMPVLMLHAELFSSETQQQDSAAEGGQVAGSKVQKATRKQKKSTKREKAKLARAAGMNSATASTEFAGDLDFLKELLDDAVVNESDVKDIVGDGIRYLHERHQRTASSGKSKSRGGAGNFLDEGRRDGNVKALKPPRGTKASQGHAMLLRLVAAEEEAMNAAPMKLGKRRNKRRPQSSPVHPMSSGGAGKLGAERPMSESGCLPSIGGLPGLEMERHLVRAVEAQEKHAQRRARQAEQNDKRDVKLGDRAMFKNGLRSEEMSGRTMTVRQAVKLDEDANGRFVTQMPAPGVYAPDRNAEAAAPVQRQRQQPRGSKRGGSRRGGGGGGGGLQERSVNTATINRLATPQKDTRSNRGRHWSEEPEPIPQAKPRRAAARKAPLQKQPVRQVRQDYDYPSTMPDGYEGYSSDDGEVDEPSWISDAAADPWESEVIRQPRGKLPSVVRGSYESVGSANEDIIADEVY